MNEKDFDKEYEKIINSVSKQMKDNLEDWESRYKGYLNIVCPNSDKSKRIKNLQRAIFIEKPLTKYLSISCADKTNRNKAVYDIRVYGHSIGNIIINLKNIDAIIKKDKISSEDRKRINEIIKKEGMREFTINETNYNALKKLAGYFPKPDNNELINWINEYLACDQTKFTAKTFKWNEECMTELRRIFQKANNDLKIGSEHSCENLLLKKLAESNGDIKYIKDIQPIKIAKCGFFQMPTCFSASKSNPVYSGAHGGGIDILAKTRKKGKPSELCVIEIKDEYKHDERPVIAMKQAISYAVCLDYILRSKKVNTPDLNWYNVLTGNKSILGDSININVVVAMPFEHDPNITRSKEDENLANTELEINVLGHDDTLTLHYLFFKKKALKEDCIKDGIITSLPLEHFVRHK